MADKINDAQSDKESKDRCCISTEASTHTRRCFMTGEFCSQKTNIHHERKRLYGDKKVVVSAFVIMNFSDMSDVVYKWRIKTFIESLKKYLYVDKEQKKLYCVADKKDKMEGLAKVDEIRVIRADSDPASNYVICSRICQQMQIADLIIVDVSSQNPNVFYEFGMAVALDKLILPICFSESFYKIEYPEKVKKMEAEKREETEKREIVEHHMGCYPWRKKLYEYYGIVYKQKKEKYPKSRSENEEEVNKTEIQKESKGNGSTENKEKVEYGTKYLEFGAAVSKENGFSDIQYDFFPYDARLPEDGGRKIGEVIYDKLRNLYNEAGEEDNTLVVYTMEGFLNEDQAGRCIVNFYHNITERMKEEQCFCGERVGVLVQGNGIPESDKDAKNKRNLLYNVGEIIRIGVNQATYLASKEKVQSEDVLICPKSIISKKKVEKFPQDYKENIEKAVKSHIRNRGMIIYPDNPVYIEREKNQLLEEYEKNKKKTPYLYLVMLKTLRYTNEIVVDIANNSLQSLFWLGAAHGAEIYAVTVKHELSERQREIITGDSVDRNRRVFDISGLWTAYYRSYDTEGFYHQLALAQFGIEKHSKIIPFDASWRGLKRWEYFEDEDAEELETGVNEGEDREKLALESYYRRRFWNAMLRYNRLRIYLSQRDDKDQKNEPSLRAAKWDMDAVSSLSHYLSKRSVIGEYVVITLPFGMTDKAADSVNFICVGQPTKPTGKELSEYIFEKCGGYKFQKYKRIYGSKSKEYINNVHKYASDELKHGRRGCEAGKERIQVKGFESRRSDINKAGILTVHPWAKCIKCRCENNSKAESGRQGNGIYSSFSEIGEIIKENCHVQEASPHIEIGQLILWREDGDSDGKGGHFRVSIVGSSGPATLGLSSLFVDERQKFCDFLKDVDYEKENRKKTPLYELQKRVREKLYGFLMKELRIEIMNILPKENLSKEKKEERYEIYCNSVLYAVYSYLSTVLYRYFLPFLTEKDINSIYNGVYMFVNSMKASKQSPFCLDYKKYQENFEEEVISDDLVKKIIKLIPGQVKEFLEKIKGIEIFYKVTVEIDPKGGNEKDSRKVKAIEAVDDKEYKINFFILPEADKASK